MSDYEKCKKDRFKWRLSQWPNYVIYDTKKNGYAVYYPKDTLFIPDIVVEVLILTDLLLDKKL